MVAFSAAISLATQSQASCASCRTLAEPPESASVMNEPEPGGHFEIGQREFVDDHVQAGHHPRVKYLRRGHVDLASD